MGEADGRPLRSPERNYVRRGGRYGGSEAQFRIQPIGLLNGDLSPRALALVVEWGTLHEAELMENWRRLHSDEPP